MLDKFWKNVRFVLHSVKLISYAIVLKVFYVFGFLSHTWFISKCFLGKNNWKWVCSIFLKKIYFLLRLSSNHILQALLYGLTGFYYFKILILICFVVTIHCHSSCNDNVFFIWLQAKKERLTRTPYLLKKEDKPRIAQKISLMLLFGSSRVEGFVSKSCRHNLSECREWDYWILVQIRDEGLYLIRYRAPPRGLCVTLATVVQSNGGHEGPCCHHPLTRAIARSGPGAIPDIINPKNKIIVLYKF